MERNPMTFQEIIEALNTYWAERGCLIVQPWDIEVGAGTFNPATSLRTLGPEPWMVAYVEPSRRPTDGRYGENPYRLAHYYQYQVILKPAPADSQDLYLDSLRALGLDPLTNDFRFVEDDWESPTLGASGLGWEVWCNGAEVTQYTYFQQIGSIETDPICVELTYGLERLAMYLQDVPSIFDIRWNEHLTYRDVHLETEQQYTAYYLDHPDSEGLFQRFEEYERECLRLAEIGLTFPALDYVLKASHTFNMLDAGGAISVTERAGYIARVRNLMRRVARSYVAQREEMGHPMMGRFDVRPAPAQPPARPASAPKRDREDLLFEIGCEEIPASYIDPALRQMRERIAAWFQEQRLEHGSIETVGTPRRLTLAVRELATRQEDLVAEVSGPPKKVAFDADGNPTKAALGFARGQGVAVEDLYVKETDRGEYVFAKKTIEGRYTADLLAEFLPELILDLRFPKTMRWENLRFARPIRWLVALLGEDVIDFPLDTLRSGRTTRGHRFLSSGEIVLENADLETYKSRLREAAVVADPAERKERIRAEVLRILEAEGSPPILDETLLDEVLHLVENPEAVLGTFDPAHLSLPIEVLVTSMKKHQRYFPVYNADGTLQAKFITISNGTRGGEENVRYGNERVLRARLEDAAFYWEEDRKTPFGDRVESLKRVTFQEKLGSLYDKMERVRGLVAALCDDLGLSEAERADAVRAAELCKADLTTSMVFEFAELQGIMGRYYALDAGESEPVAVAIEEHYLPLSATSELPKTTLGALLSIADKIDTIVGYFGIGLVPSGSQDPYSLRRQSIGILRILLDRKIPLSLDTLIDRAASAYPADSPAEAVRAFFRDRLEVILEERGGAYDSVDALLSAGFDRVSELPARLDVLTAFRESPDFERVYPAFNRLLRILPEGDYGEPSRELMRDPSEIRLAEAVDALRPELDAKLEARDFARLLDALATLQPTIDTFFDDVLVMEKDEAVRTNRLALLNSIARYLLSVADFTKLVIAGAEG